MNHLNVELAAYLVEDEMHYNQMVKMADVMAQRGGAYGEKESMYYLEKASSILFKMQLVSSNPTSYDLEIN